MINSWDGVHIDEYRTSNYEVFSVFRKGRQWKRLQSKQEGEAALWIERIGEGDNVPVSGMWVPDILSR